MSRSIPAFKKFGATYSGSWKVLSQEQVLENDRVVNKTVVRDYDPAVEHAKYTASDFYLENVIAAGAYDMLKPRQYSDVNLEIADRLDVDTEMLFDSIDSQSAEDKNNENE